MRVTLALLHLTGHLDLSIFFVFSAYFIFSAYVKYSALSRSCILKYTSSPLINNI